MWFRERKAIFQERNPPPRHTADTSLWAAFPKSSFPPPLPRAEVKDWWSWRVSDNLPNHTSLLLLLPRLPAQLLLLCAHHHLLPPCQEPPCSSSTPVPASSSLPRSVCHYCSWTGTEKSGGGEKSILVGILHVGLALLKKILLQTGASRALWTLLLKAAALFKHNKPPVTSIQRGLGDRCCTSQPYTMFCLTKSALFN